MFPDLAIDAGQSGIRAHLMPAAVVSTSIRPLREIDTTRHQGIRTDLPLSDQVRQIIEDIVGAEGVVRDVAVGLTGLTADEDLSGLQALGVLGIRTVAIAHDSVTSYLGALGARPGAVVAAGTGAVTLAVGEHTSARVDGWGNIMGDAGSGYWFGRAALDAAMRAYDGRGPSTGLLDHLRADLGEVESAYLRLQSDSGRVRRIASFARWVSQAEAMGDRVAREICKRGGAELAASVSAGLDRVRIGVHDPAEVCAIGGVFRSQAISDAFRVALLAARPLTRVIRPRGDGLRGASELLRLDPTSSLRARVLRITVNGPRASG